MEVSGYLAAYMAQQTREFNARQDAMAAARRAELGNPYHWSDGTEVDPAEIDANTWLATGHDG